MSSGGTEKPAGGARRGPGSPASGAHGPESGGAGPGGAGRGDAGRKPSAARPSSAKAGRAAEPGPSAAGAERRKHARVQTRVPFRILDESGREEPFRLVDLSECGARIQVQTAIPPMTRIQVALVLPVPPVASAPAVGGTPAGPEKGVRVDTSGVVVWCHPTEGAYDTGVFFPDLAEGQRRLLRNLVHAAS